MSYTALEKMRACNHERYGEAVGPVQPALHAVAGAHDLSSVVMRFLHDRCEGLGFDAELTSQEQSSGTYLGNSYKPGQIPHDMQADIDRLCLERELERFIESGSADDAYTIYYCYLSIFFGHYGSSKAMVELLSEFESNGSSLLMKHRDHYSHSVYVFALGLAIYESSAAFRSAFKSYYKFESADDRDVAHFFLEYWGLTSLFHDIGYPFELPFEQVLSYFEVDRQKRGPGSVFIAYRDVERLTNLRADAQARLEELYGRRFSSVPELLAHDVANKLGEAYGVTEYGMLDVIESKPRGPERFGYFMDHAWFSAMRLFQELVETFGGASLKRAHVDALSAILLHNSMFKFSISFYKDPARRRAPLAMEKHPLAYLLMYCDELQCWDRTSYGRNSRTELHPWKASFDFSDGGIVAKYVYDAEEQAKIDTFKAEYRAWEENGAQGEPPRLKAYSDMAGGRQRFVEDIRLIVDTRPLPLTVHQTTDQVDRGRKRVYLSASSFLHLYDFAIVLNGRYTHEDRVDEVSPEQLQDEFDSLSLEYQLSNINQAKNFGRYLDAIRCFYTDRPVDYDLVGEFSQDQIDTFAPMEHERWVREHQDMGWQAGDLYERLPLAEGESASDVRERLRMHKLTLDEGASDEDILAHYTGLPAEDQGKDWKPFETMFGLIKKFDGLRIYQLDPKVREQVTADAEAGDSGQATA